MFCCFTIFLLPDPISPIFFLIRKGDLLICIFASLLKARLILLYTYSVSYTSRTLFGVFCYIAFIALQNFPTLV